MKRRREAIERRKSFVSRRAFGLLGDGRSLGSRKLALFHEARVEAISTGCFARCFVQSAGEQLVTRDQRFAFVTRIRKRTPAGVVKLSGPKWVSGRESSRLTGSEGNFALR
jgi:hypothetical protein